jgi:hypothetical protein
MAVAVNVGTGSTLTGAGIGAYTTAGSAAQLTDLQWSGITRESLATSHMGTTQGGTFGGHTFMPGDLADPGEITATWHFDPDLTPPVNVASGAIVATFPEGDTFTGTGFCTSFEINDPLEDIMTCTITYKVTGNMTIA